MFQEHGTEAPQVGLRSASAGTFLPLLIVPGSGNDHPLAFISSIRMIRPNMSVFHPSLSLLYSISM